MSNGAHVPALPRCSLEALGGRRTSCLTRVLQAFSGGPYHSERRLIKTKRAQLVSLYMRGVFFFFGGGGKQKYFTTLFVFFFLEASLAVVKHGRDSCGCDFPQSGSTRRRGAT